MDNATEYVNKNQMIINQTCNTNDCKRCLVSMATKKIQDNGRRLIKCRTHDQVFLDKFLGSLLAPVYNEQVFFRQFFPDRGWTGLFLAISKPRLRSFR